MNNLLEFPREEIENRIVLCQQKMNRTGLSGMIVSAESNLNYYSDYHTHAPWTTFTRPSFLFIPLKGVARPKLCCTGSNCYSKRM